MKIFSAEALAALEDGTALVGGAVDIACDPPVCVWSGEGPLPLAGTEFTGIGQRGLITVSGGSVGGAAQSITLSLSGVEPAHLELLDADDLQGAPVVIYRLIFDGSGTRLLDHKVFARGRLDQLPTDETVGGDATINAIVETAARGLGRRGARMRTDADQRMVEPGDGGFRHVSYAGQKTLYWGGKKPSTAGSAVGGVLAGVTQNVTSRARQAQVL